MSVKGRGHRLLHCVSSGAKPDSERCAQLLASLATRAWKAPHPEGVPMMEQQAAIAGRRVQAPEGCEVSGQDNAGAVRCKSAELNWVLTLEAEQLTALADRLYGGMKAKEGFRTDEVACSLEGVATRCRRLWDREQVVGYEGRAVVRKQHLLAFCFFDAPGKEVPAACASVLRLP